MNSFFRGGTLAFLVLWPAFGRGTLLDTPAGKVEGQREGKTLVFKGIPYASPPVGEARWRPPAAMPRWEGVRKAMAFGPACYQPTITVQTIYTRPAMPMSEDCLTLNVWAPA